MSSLRLDPGAVVADLDELADQSGGRFAGADRLAWTPAWLSARRWLRAKLEAIGLAPDTDAAGNLWAAIDGESDGFLIVGSHIDAGNCQMLWIGSDEVSQAATFSSVIPSSWLSSSVTRMPSLNFTPSSTSATRWWPLNRRQRSWAVASSL